MITTSYIAENIMKLDKEVKEANLIFMNEIGLDPGIDHLITHKVINEAKRKEQKILSYESWCGALCAPEYLDNPLLYKFSWSPRGVLIALKNEARQMINGKVIQIPSNEVLTNTVNKRFHPCFSFEGYYNRDSFMYKDIYDLKDATTVIRGTIRYKGFGFIFQCLKNLSFFDLDKFQETYLSWKDYLIINIIKKNIDIINYLKQVYLNNFLECMIKDEEKEDPNENIFYLDLCLFALSKFKSSYLIEHGFNNLLNDLLPVLRYLELFNEKNKVKIL
jgi:saccharopine dehydrogenase-like NADP-dependent oxidoreductase